MIHATSRTGDTNVLIHTLTQFAIKVKHAAPDPGP